MAQKDAREDVVAKLSNLRDQLSTDQFERAKLFLSCYTFQEDQLDDAKDLVDLLTILDGIPDDKTRLPSISILQYILVFLGVKQASSLMASSEDLERAKIHLAFPALLVDLCRSLGNDSFDRFKKPICYAVLKCDHSNIQSREHLMRELVQREKISHDNVEVLKKWLGTTKLNMLASKVNAYEEGRRATIAPYVSQAHEEVNESQDSRMIESVSILAKQVCVSEKALNRLVLDCQLKDLEKFISEHQPLLAGRLDSPLSSWRDGVGSKLTYRALCEDLLKKHQHTAATKVCELAKLNLFCVDVPVNTQDSLSSLDIPPGSLPGVIQKNLLWEKRSPFILRVYFINPEVLRNESWKCGDEPLTTEHILAWAFVWNNPAYTNYPRISTDRALNLQESEIRIEFGTETVCWSMVGRRAQDDEYKNKTTMYLNLRNRTVKDQRSLVRHEFGHALGLEHEHQRWDFWDVLDDLVVDKNNLPYACDEHLRRPWVKSKRMQTSYDSDSIMHYWFLIEWLKPQFWDLEEVRKMPESELSKIKKDVIEVVHKRNGSMAESPSRLDFEALDQAYRLPY